MAKRSKRKCPICNLTKDVEEMTPDEKTKRYYCKEKCYPLFLRRQEWKAKELAEWNELYEYIKDLHGLINIPVQHITRLQNLRAGEKYNKVTREYERAWKNGPSYALMLEAYKIGNKDIQESFHTLLHDKRQHSSVSYCISIMEGNLNKALSQRQKNQEQEMIKQRVLNQEKTKKVYASEPNANKNPTPSKKKKDNRDISDFL